MYIIVYIYIILKKYKHVYNYIYIYISMLIFQEVHIHVNVFTDAFVPTPTGMAIDWWMAIITGYPWTVHVWIISWSRNHENIHENHI